MNVAATHRSRLLKVALALVFFARRLGLNRCAYGPYCHRRLLVFSSKNRKVLASKNSGMTLT